jgi:hypothetical protein
MGRGLAAGLLAVWAAAPSRAAEEPKVATVRTQALQSEIQAFLDHELSAHLEAIPSLDPPPERIYGALTTGEFSWGSFMRALGEYHELSGTRTLAGRDLPQWVGRMGLIEAKAGKEFSQLYSAMALRSFGRDLEKNPVWHSLDEDARRAWMSLLDPSRFYDSKTGRVLSNENYLGVAVRILVISNELGLKTDRASIDALLDRAAVQFTSGNVYFDDQPPVGRYDRYSQEAARYLWFAATNAGRKDVLDALRPSLKVQMRLWWDLVSRDGYGFTWGRSLGLIGYLDTMEIVAFLAQNPEFRPAPLPELAGAFHAAWQWARADFKDDRHLFAVLDFGRGNYMYINREREWQQTATSLGKIASAAKTFFPVLQAEHVDEMPRRPPVADIARFEWFRRGDRPAGVWMVRQGGLHFALPITTGTFSGAADYLPAPHGLPGFGAPVEQPYPALVPFIELEGRLRLVAGDGADTIVPGADGRSVTATWRRWAKPAAEAKATKDYMKQLELVDPGLTSEVRYRIEGGRLVREETWTATKPLHVRRLRLAVPSTYAEYRREGRAPAFTHVFSSAQGALAVSIPRTDWPLTATIEAMADSPLGRGDRGGLPLHLVLEAKDVDVVPGRPLHLTLVLEPREVSAAGREAGAAN